MEQRIPASRHRTLNSTGCRVPLDSITSHTVHYSNFTVEATLDIESSAFVTQCIAPGGRESVSLQQQGNVSCLEDKPLQQKRASLQQQGGLWTDTHRRMKSSATTIPTDTIWLLWRIIGEVHTVHCICPPVLAGTYKHIVFLRSGRVCLTRRKIKAFFKQVEGAKGKKSPTELCCRDCCNWRKIWQANVMMISKTLIEKSTKSKTGKSEEQQTLIGKLQK